MRTFKRCLCVLLILALSLSVGLICNQVWLAIKKASHPTPYGETVALCSAEFGVPESVVYAVIKTESDFDPLAVSSVGARGLMQMMESTFDDVRRELGQTHTYDDLFTPEISIRYGTYYLRYLYDMFGSWHLAFAAYNGGLGNVKRWLADPECTDGEGNLSYIPFEETRSYVYKVEKSVDAYEALYYSNQQGGNK